MKQVGEVLNGPIVEYNHHPFVLSYTLSNAGNVGPKPVACLSWGITDNSHNVLILSTKIRKQLNLSKLG